MDSGYEADFSDNEDFKDLHQKKHQLKPKSFFNAPRFREYFNDEGVLSHYIINGPIVNSSESTSPNTEITNITNSTNTSSSDGSKIGEKRKHSCCNDETTDKKETDDDNGNSPKNPRYSDALLLWLPGSNDAEMES